jgi:RNA polymerase sigma-70 factor (ECF subfamily)
MERLYARHNVRVHRFVLRIIGNATIAEDIVSEVFLDVWRHAKRFKEKSRVSTWLLGIARNKSLSIARQRSVEPLDEQLSAVIEDPSDDPETAVVKKDQSAVIRKSLLEIRCGSCPDRWGAGKHRQNPHVLCPPSNARNSQGGRIALTCHAM